MNGDEKRPFADELAALCLIHGQPFSKELAGAWWKFLEDLDAGDVLEAMRQLGRSWTRMPKPADVRQLVAGGVNHGAADAWLEVRRWLACRPCHYLDAGFDRAILDAVEQLGGMRALCGMDSFQLERARGDFERLYRQAVPA